MRIQFGEYRPPNCQKIFLKFEIQWPCDFRQNYALSQHSRGIKILLLKIRKLEYNSTIFWDTTPCSLLKVNFDFDFNGLHGVISRR
jgi:hypothetical protein